MLTEEFPDATILFCQWHVMKAIFKKLVECDVDKSERDEVRELIRQLVYSGWMLMITRIRSKKSIPKLINSLRNNSRLTGIIVRKRG